MNWQGNLLVFGTLAFCVLAIIAGAAVKAPWAGALLAIGILGLIAWVCFALWLGNAMNTDI